MSTTRVPDDFCYAEISPQDGSRITRNTTQYAVCMPGKLKHSQIGAS